MSKKIRIKIKKPYIAYPGSTIQQNYAEDQVHGFLDWTISSRDNFDVKFKELPNPKPYITIPWLGTLASTVESAVLTCTPGARFRVHSKEILSQRDVVDISTSLRDKLSAMEVTFKTDHQVQRDVIFNGSTTVIKEDLRNPDVLVKLIKEYHHEATVPEHVWGEVVELVRGYASQAGLDEIARNTKWSIKHVKFDNTLAYGDGNVINFELLNGIVGIFGPNRCGKSSIVGTIMYGLFNGTDRGSIKNLHVVNTRKPYCYTRFIINVDGTTDYVIERQTTKNENKRGQINASTALNVYRMEDGEAVDLAGEQRNDTERVIRKLIGTPEDFMLTSLSAQDEIKMFLSQGSTKRRQNITKFLDLDIFDKMHDMAQKDMNSTKGELRQLPDRDWDGLTEQLNIKISSASRKIDDKTSQHVESMEVLEDCRKQLHAHKDFTPVTKSQVDSHRARVTTAEEQLGWLEEKFNSTVDQHKKLLDKIRTIEQLEGENNLDDMRKRLAAFRSLDASVVALKMGYERESTLQKQQKRSLAILDQVPCGDKFPSCKFIKDAHQIKPKAEAQDERVSSALERLSDAQKSLSTLREEGLDDKVTKLEKLIELRSKYQLDAAAKQLEMVKDEASVDSIKRSLEPLRAKLSELEEALKNEENAEVVALRSRIDQLQSFVRTIDSEKLELASERGRLRTMLEKLTSERASRELTLERIRAHELIAQAFSRKGIPSVITSSQLPVINSEIAKILQGIVDFTIELETDDESDSMEVYINYGDSRRIIELCSGMEKMIASVAIRVALINISSLPKTDMFILDEGFGSLDEAAVESCNRLLISLKRYFKIIIVITHVEGVKDVADVVLEISKNEKDSRVIHV